MNTIFISIDSLNRHYLKAYGQTIEYPVATPNLDAFARRAATFDAHYTGSLPCMPARREFFAGVQEFLWRPWGPMEPFDQPLARLARGAGYVTQLITDHYHLFQHGSHGYYEDYQGFEFIRGHEYDAWRTAPRDPDPTLLRQTLADDPGNVGYMNRAAYARNAAALTREEDFFAPQVFAGVARWLAENRDRDRRLLVVDSFDVHEPFHCPEPYASLYTDEDPRDPALVNWPYYGRIDRGQSRLSERQVAFVRAQYAGKLTMVDRWLGRVFDTLDAQGAWGDTAVIITTDHGHFLGDHGWMGKPHAPMYNTLCHIPLFIWHPGAARMGGRIGALTATVDLYATILETLGLAPPAGTHSRSLLPLLRGERDAHRDWALYGYWGSTVNVTDGRHTYLHPCRDDLPAYCYSTQMMNPWSWFTPPKPRPAAEAGRFVPYAGDCPVWRYPDKSSTRHEAPLLFDLHADAAQNQDLAGQGDPAEERMRALLVTALGQLRAPEEQYARLGLEREV
jgi:arylsulfatase A-like enzyme